MSPMTKVDTPTETLEADYTSHPAELVKGGVGLSYSEFQS